MALLQIRRGNSGSKGTLQYGEPFFNSNLQTVQFGASGSEEITLVKLNTGIAGVNVWGSSSIYENSGSLSVTGDITASNAYIRGNLTVSGNIVLGNIAPGQTTSSDSITVIADFSSDLIPDISNSFDLGSATRYWKSAYVGSLLLNSLSGIDARNNIVYVNDSNELTASNDFEYIPGEQVRIGSGSEDRFWVKTNTGDTFISGNLYISGASDGIRVVGPVESLNGSITGEFGKFHNLSNISGGAGVGAVVLTSGSGELTNNGDLKFDGQFLRVGGNNFTVDATNGNVFTNGILNVMQSAEFESNVGIAGNLITTGSATINNQLSVLGDNGRIVVNKDVVIGNGLYVTGGIDSRGNVRLNAGNVGYTEISGNLFIGSNSQTSITSISGAFSQEYSGSGLEILHKRISPVRNASIIFDDDTNPIIAGAPGRIILRNQSTDGNLDSQITTGVTSSGINVSNGGGSFGILNAGYTNPTDSTSIRVNIGATNGIGLNSRTQVLTNLSVTGSTVFGRDATNFLDTHQFTGSVSITGSFSNPGSTAYLGNLKVSESLEVSGSTTLLGRLKIGDLVTSASGLIEGSASIAGDLTVRGNAVYLGVDRLSTDANLLELASGSTAGFEAEGAGLYISTSLVGGNASIKYTTTGSSERFIVNKGVYIIGDPNDNYGLQISNNTHISGNLDVDGNLTVDGVITLVNANITNAAINTLNITASAAVTGNLEVNGNLSVTGSTNLGDAAGDKVQIPGTLNVSGAVKNGSTLNVSGAVGLDSTLNVTGSTAISGGLFVSGNTELSSSLRVKENSFFEKDLNVSGNLTVDGNVNILGDVVTVNVGNLQIEDKNVIIARGSLSSLQSDAGGITIEGPTTPIQFTWDHANQRMNLNKNFNISGSLLIQGDDIIDTAVALAIALG
jgi:cytoskeletal protein CcmA (bactofilin family)